MKKIVFLPIETEARELDAKLVLASKIVSKEVTCLVGQHNALNSLVDLFKHGGTYIGKNIFSKRYQMLMIKKRMKKKSITFRKFHLFLKSDQPIQVNIEMHLFVIIKLPGAV